MRFIANTSGMKKPLVFFIVVSIAFICAIRFGMLGLNKNKQAVAYNRVVVKNGTKCFELDTDSDENITLLRKSINEGDREQHIEVIDKILSMGFCLKDALCYVYPNIEKSIDEICNYLQVLPTEPSVYADINNCKIIFQNAKNGIKVDKNALFNDFYASIKENKDITVQMCEVNPDKTVSELKNNYVLVSQFKTSFKTSSDARKHNIRHACSVLNGQFIKSGQTFSFNHATGPRTKENGYKEAKIIIDGAYTDGYGGGVCQVSSTLYNACLLAGLDIAEVHNHSLPTGYVDPCFDAMVSSGSSDLKIKNNTCNDFLITCSTLNDECWICIYGVMPDYKISTRYEKYELLPAGEDILETNVSKYINKELNVGENRISFPVDGYKAKGYLDYYKDGVLIKSRLIRDDTYRPKKGVVLFVERAESE